MSIRIVHEYRAPAGLSREIAGALVRLLGGLLILVGLLASTLPVVYLLEIIVILALDPGKVRGMAPDGRLVIVALVAATSLIIGFWLLRGRRRLVLFLRRFGFTEATQAVTFAVVKALGSSWRLVTLDDAQISPVGARKRMRWLSIALGVVGVAVVAWALFWLFGGGFETLVSETAGRAVRGATPKDILPRLLVTIFVVPIVVIAGVFFVIVLPAVFAGVVAVFAWSSYGALRRVERGKTVQITHEDQIEPSAAAVLRRSRGIVGPRLAVAKVASSIWQPVVRRLAGASSAVIFDISKPTDNLLWEIETLGPEMRSRWILVGEQTHLRRMTSGVADHESSSHARLLRLLDGEQVLAYSSDARDLLRFARSLHARLETLPSA